MINLIHGDCLEEMPGLAEGSVDAIIVDPPYGTTKCKWDTCIPFGPMWDQVLRVIKSNGAIVIFGTQPFTSSLIMSNPALYRYDWMWKKDKAANWLFGNKMPLKIYENISVFYRRLPTYNPQKRDNPDGPSRRHLSKNPAKITNAVRSIMGDGWKETKMGESQNYCGSSYDPDKLLPTTELYFPRDQRGRLHPTQKPLGLLEYLIKTYTNEGETVLDFCMGSGTTGVAAKKLNRHFVGIELDLEYFNAAENRILTTYPSEGVHD